VPLSSIGSVFARAENEVAVDRDLAGAGAGGQGQGLARGVDVAAIAARQHVDRAAAGDQIHTFLDAAGGAGLSQLGCDRDIK